MALATAREIAARPCGHDGNQIIVAIQVLEGALHRTAADEASGSLLRMKLADEFPESSPPPRRRARPPSGGGSGVRANPRAAPVVPSAKRPLYLECRDCRHVWPALWLPMGLSTAVRVLSAVACPHCGSGGCSIIAGPERISRGAP